MATKIDQKIVAQRVVEPTKQEEEIKPTTIVEVMSETFDRPNCLVGSTYKLKTPNNPDHALYITINDVILNEGTEAESRHPYEVFFNTKDTSHFQWVAALSRLLSAVCRKGGDVVFIVDELKAVFDPKGGYLKKGKFVPSLIADIGYVFEEHFKKIGLIKEEVQDEEVRKFIEKKKEEILSKQTEEPKGQLCPKCYSLTVFRLDGCMTCTSCGDSKCG